MSRTKEADLISAAFVYAARCLAQGDSHALREMNFGTREVEALRALTVMDIEHAASLRGHFLSIRLDRAVYWQIMAHLGREREAQALQHALIRADAPLEMLQALFGIRGREHTALCSLLGVRPSVGRPAVADEQTTRELWTSYRARRDARDVGGPTAHEYLALHQETGASLRAIWALVQAWERDGGAREGPPVVDGKRARPAVAKLRSRDA